MKVNSDVVISTPKVLLVPYERRHVQKYHEWMQDEKLCQATASIPLTLDEEYENQQSWRDSHSKLTFILCQPLGPGDDQRAGIVAGEADAPARMIGDVNLFIGDCSDLSEENARGRSRDPWYGCFLEVSVMVAEESARRQGVGRAAVCAALAYVARHAEEVVTEFFAEEDKNWAEWGMHFTTVEFKALIHSENKGSIKLFKGIGFDKKRGGNYFGEVEMNMPMHGAEAMDWFTEPQKELRYERES